MSPDAAVTGIAVSGQALTVLICHLPAILRIRAASARDKRAARAKDGAS